MMIWKKRFVYGFVIFSIFIFFKNAREQSGRFSHVTFYPFRAYRPSKHVQQVKFEDLFGFYCKDEQFDKEQQSLKNFIKDGFFVQDATPSFYLYRQKDKDNCFISIIGLASLDSCEKGYIKRHEHTIADREIALETFLRMREGNDCPILLVYEALEPITTMINTILKRDPDQTFILKEKTEHCIWVIDDQKDTTFIQDVFANYPYFYIADGHHRMAVAKRMKDDDHILAAVSSNRDINISSFCRIIKTLNGIEPEAFFSRITTYFDVKAVDRAQDAFPYETHTFGMYFNGKWYMLQLKPFVLQQYEFEAFKSLDIVILYDLIIDFIWGSDASKISENVESIGKVESMSALEELCILKNGIVAFALHPVLWEQFCDVVDSGQVMPAKSTWFEPKIPAGLVVRFTGTTE